MIKVLRLVGIVLCFGYCQSVFAQAKTVAKPTSAMFPTIIGGICKEASFTLEGKKGDEFIYRSSTQQAFLDLETHYFGMLGKLGMFKTDNAKEMEMARAILDIDRYAIEFKPDNPNALIKPLEVGQSVEVKVPGVLWISNHKQRLPVNFTFSRDQDGKYHARGGFVVNLEGLEIKIPAEYKELLNGAFRFSFAF